MPYMITSPGSRQTHPIYKTPDSANSGKKTNDNKENSDIPKTYDAIKNAAGCDTKVKSKK